ncbi:tail protein X [uncultured Paracoccus sp.]|uniref:tail protein X n=1 Tax=uncultured Paracoccus sp. TaxID=189685 RepID=UPI0025F2DCDF|nr:tail protein X [uncultured Paracoccus sp.]
MTADWPLSCVSEEGETVDRLVWRALGRQDGRLVPDTLHLNPGLADAGPTLPAGLVVRLPRDVLPDAAKVVRLWD